MWSRHLPPCPFFGILAYKPSDTITGLSPLSLWYTPVFRFESPMVLNYSKLPVDKAIGFQGRANGELSMLGFQDDENFGRIREALQQASYTESGIGAVLSCEHIFAISLKDMPRAMRHTQDPSPLNTLIRLFFLRVPVEAHEASEALAPLSVEAGIEGGLLQLLDTENQVKAKVDLWPIRDLLLVADVSKGLESDPCADMVLPPGPVALHLANTMIPLSCERVLDLGTGSGILALLASGRAQAVVATDLNDKAVTYARFNAKLNNLENVICRKGSLFEPVREDRFQHIVCNPPYVIGPHQRYLFRDSGLRGDVFCQRLIREAINYLDSDGFLQLTANLPHLTGRPWKEDMESWFAGLPCDVLVLVEERYDIADYAMTWILTTESHDVDRVPELFNVWIDYFEKEKIEGISQLLITVRRSDAGGPWIQIDDPPCHIVGPCGHEIARFFAVRDAWQAEPEKKQWLNRKLRLAPHAHIEQEHVMSDRGLKCEHTRIRKTGGLRYPLDIDTTVARLLAGCDGSRSLEQNLQDLAIFLNVDYDKAAKTCMPIVQSLLERSVLLPK